MPLRTFEAARDKSLVAHQQFLDSLLKEDFTLGTHQGPMLPFHTLSGYVWEDTKLVHGSFPRKMANVFYMFARGPIR